MNLLIPTDFSNNSIKAIRFALNNYPNDNLILVHIVNVRQAGATFVVDINQDLKVVNEKKMTVLIDQLLIDYPNLNLSGRVVIGLFSDAIIEEIINTKADILVLGTKGASGIDEILLGSNAYLAIKNANIPLVVINNSYGYNPPKKILLASDFEGELSDEAANHLLEFVKRFDAKLEVVHISNSGEGFKTHVKINHLIDDVVTHFHVLEAENIEEEIVTYAEKKNFDFIALAPKERGILKNLFHQSVTKRICASAKSPLYIIK